MRIIARNAYEPSTVEGTVDVRVFFDVFRASTTLAALASRAPALVLSTNELEVVRRHQAAGFTLVSEVFDGGLDNSPTQVLRAGLGGGRVVHKSTNLTTAIFHCGLARRTFVGGFVNASAVAAVVRASAPRTVELVAAGHFAKGREAIEDTAGAALLAAMLREGGLPREAPLAAEVAAKVADLRARKRDLPAHYWDDLALALTIDALPIAVEAVAYSEERGVIEMRRAGES